jgi:hypothetical protein
MESRRLFLKRVGQAALLAAAGRCPAQTSTRSANDFAQNLPHLTTIPSGGPIPDSVKSVVVDNRNPMILAGPQLHEAALTILIDEAIRLVTNCTTMEQAWRKLFKADDVIGIKFDEVGYAKLNTTDVLAELLVKSLEGAGFKRDRIVLIEVPDALAGNLKTRPRAFGWQEEETVFASGRERMAKVLDQVSALINVPFLKTDNITGVAGALRNVSLPFVRRQARYFANGGTPFIPDIVALPEIRSRLKLNLVNGLRAVFDKGPEVHPGCIWPHAGILVSTDPVAVDSVSVDLINTRRNEANLPPIGDAKARLPHIHAAAQHGLGTDDQDYIRLLTPHNS